MFIEHYLEMPSKHILEFAVVCKVISQLQWFFVKALDLIKLVAHGSAIACGYFLRLVHLGSNPFTEFNVV